jgi:hypothetical protein
MLFHQSPGAQQRRPILARRESSALVWPVPAVALIASLALLAFVGHERPAAAQINPCKPIHLPVLTAPPDANAQMEMREQAASEHPQDYTAANGERRKQISDDSARLLKLATELKTEVDKTTKDTLSLGVIRKADEIERLAHSVKEKMKLTVGAN